jgi:steroid 5-alpha reductase family enzyme
MNNYILAILEIFIYFSVIFVIAQIKNNNSIVDIAWGLGFVILSWVMFIYDSSLERIVIPLLVTVWGLRLSYHIFIRNAGKPEDFRYVDMRKSWERDKKQMLFSKFLCFKDYCSLWLL